jgi:hypothetical protein
MKEGVRWRGIGQEILVASTASSPQCGKRLRRLRSDPPLLRTGHVALFGRYYTGGLERHLTLGEVARYTRAADHKRLAYMGQPAPRPKTVKQTPTG